MYKRNDTIRGIIRRTCCVAVIFLYAAMHASGQLSRSLVLSLPAGCQPVPADKPVLNTRELSAIVLLAGDSSRFRFNKEIDSLAVVLSKTEGILRDTTPLMALASYHYQKGLYKQANFYCDRIIALCGDRDKNTRYSYEAQKAYTFLLMGNYEECITSILSRLEKAKAEQDSIDIASLYLSLYAPYLKLGLYHASSDYLDSSIAFFTNFTGDKSAAPNFRIALELRFACYLCMYEETDSAYLVQKMQQAAISGKKYFDIKIFKLVPALQSYLRKDYAATILLSDSLDNTIPVEKNKPRAFTSIYLYKYKAFSLYYLGQKEKALKMLDTVLARTYAYTGQYPVLKTYASSMLKQVSAFLYTAYKTLNEPGKALYYLELNKHLSDTLDILKSRGITFETNQRYNFNKKDAEVKQLANDTILRKKQRDIAVAAIIAVLLSLVLITSLLVNRYKKLTLKKQLAEQEAANQVDKLNIASQLQIDELEEKNRIARSEEQKRLGRDLHDNLSGVLAAAKIKLENEAIKTANEKLHAQLKDIASQLSVAYESTRNKSHQWYSTGNDGISFSKRIHHIVENALGSDLYIKDIIIDDGVVARLDTTIKISILRIIQESVTNILKHAKAHNVYILIYEGENGNAVTEISDNGKGMGGHATGMGLESIARRAKEMNGQLQIASSHEGTTIRIIIPALPMTQAI